MGRIKFESKLSELISNFTITGNQRRDGIMELYDIQQSTNLAKIKELEETVKDRESHATFLQEKRNELQTECDNRLEKIKDLEAQLPKWISVEDRLPEHNQDVVMYVQNWNDNLYKVIGYFHDDKKFYLENDTVTTCSVLYWMPVPQPQLKPQER